jgi:hypothetical protein
MSRVPSQVHKNGEGNDRQPLSDEDIERARQLAFEAIDPRDLRRDWSAMVTLRWRLDKIFEALGGTLTRETAVLLLRAISQSIKPATKVSGGLGGAPHRSIRPIQRCPCRSRARQAQSLTQARARTGQAVSKIKPTERR